MRSSAHAFALLAAFAASCVGGQTGDEGALNGRGSHTMGSDSEGKGVKGGGGNAVGCKTDLDCSSSLDFLAELLAAPIDNPRTPLGSECLPARDGCGEHAFCACTYQQNTEEEGPTNFVLGLGLNAPCDVYSRDGTCLLAADAFKGCDVDDASSCDAACAHALDAWASDDARTLDVQARHASCALTEHECRYVLEVEGRCHPRSYVKGPVYDCALSDAEILSRAFPANAGDAGPSDELGALPQCTGGDGCDEGEPYGSLACQIRSCDTQAGRSMPPCRASGGGGDGGVKPQPRDADGGLIP